MTEKQFEKELKNLRFGIVKDLDDAVTVTRGAENIADIYNYGGFTTCFIAFKALPAKEKLDLTNLITIYVSSLVGVSA